MIIVLWTRFCWFCHSTERLQEPFHLVYFALVSIHGNYALAAAGCFIVGIVTVGTHCAGTLNARREAKHAAADVQGEGAANDA